MEVGRGSIKEYVNRSLVAVMHKLFQHGITACDDPGYTSKSWPDKLRNGCAGLCEGFAMVYQNWPISIIIYYKLYHVIVQCFEKIGGPR